MERLQPWQRDVQKAPPAAGYARKVGEMTMSQLRDAIQADFNTVSDRLGALHKDAGPKDHATGKHGTPLFERENHWGKMSAGEHVRKLVEYQTRLRVALKEYRDRGGNPHDIHPQAWKRATTRNNRAWQLRRPGGDNGPGSDGGGGNGSGGNGGKGGGEGGGKGGGGGGKVGGGGG